MAAAEGEPVMGGPACGRGGRCLCWPCVRVPPPPPPTRGRRWARGSSPALQGVFSQPVVGNSGCSSRTQAPPQPSVELVGGVLGLRGVSTGVCRCRKTALFSLLLGKFGELPNWALLREEKQVSREAAERRGLGAAVPGDSPDPPGRSTGGKAAASLHDRTVPAKGGSGLCISVGLAGPTCCAGAVRGSESLSKSCPLCSMNEATAGLGCVKDLR